MVGGNIIEKTYEIFVHLYNAFEKKVDPSVIVDVDESKLFF